jgi:hypothetical protein
LGVDIAQCKRGLNGDMSSSYDLATSSRKIISRAAGAVVAIDQSKQSGGQSPTSPRSGAQMKRPMW